MIFFPTEIGYITLPEPYNDFWTRRQAN